jgi:hypothetical protein
MWGSSGPRVAEQECGRAGAELQETFLGGPTLANAVLLTFDSYCPLDTTHLAEP